MSKSSILLIIFVLVLGLTLALSINMIAQDDDLIDYVLDALANTYQQSSAHSTMEQTIEQNISVQGLSVNMIITQTGDGSVLYEDGGVDAMEITLEQAWEGVGVGSLIPDSGMTLDMILVDGELYLQVSSASGLFAGTFPEGWSNTRDLGATFPINTSQYVDLLGNPLQFQLDDETIISIEELDGETLEDGDIDTRVIEVELDLEAVFNSPNASTALEAFDFSSLGLPASELQDLMSQMFEGATGLMTVWIGEDDDLIYQSSMEMAIDSELTLMGQAMTLEMTMNTLQNFTDYNEPVTITAPVSDK